MMHSCLGCLRAAPAKDLTTPYAHLGKTEIYSHMLRECFDLQVSLSLISECGICEVCVSRLRDANEFKLQVEQSLSELQEQLTQLEMVKDEPEVELEIEYVPDISNDVLVKAEGIFKEPTCPEANNLLANNVELYVEKVTADGLVLGSERTLEVATASNQTLEKESDPEPEFILGDALSDTSATPEQLQDANNTGATSGGQSGDNNANPDVFILGDSLSDTPATPEQPQACNAGRQASDSKKPGGSILRHVLSNTPATASSNAGATRELHPIDSANPYECGRCGEGFSKIILLSQHISENHRQKTKKRLPTSAVRTRSTKSKGNVLTAKIEPKKVIRSKPKLTEIKETIIVKPYSPDTKIYTCNACGKTFANKSNLYLHMNSHEEKLFSCEFCSKEFSNLGNMREHRRIHTGEKPFICNICSRPFAGLAGLIKHKQKHAVEKPYYCELCKKDFGNYHTLKVHKRVHTGEKPYLCEVCDKRFISASSLIKHKLCHSRGMTGHVIDD